MSPRSISRPIPRISVVVATYHRAETLLRTLRHLAGQDLPPDDYEVIVVSDASPDDTARVVPEFAREAAFEVRYLENSVNRGPGHTQNRGIADARAPLVLLIADDIWLSPGALRAHLETHRRHPAAGTAVAGRVEQSPELTQTVFLSKWDPFRYRDLAGMEELPAYRFWACNVSFQRQFMIEHGMFREEPGRAGPSWLEDLELGYRLKAKGMRLFYAEDAWGYHYHVCSFESAAQRFHEKGMNYGQFRGYAADPELDVFFHVLNWRTWRRYARVLRGPNSFQGRERSFVWHLVRHLARLSILNRLTAALVWRPAFALAETNGWVAARIGKNAYRAYFYYQFLRGVAEGRRRFGGRW